MPDLAIDLPLEYCNYRDEGCELSPSCLGCHLSQCVLDVKGGMQRLRLTERKGRIKELRRKGRNISQITKEMKVSRRTIFRALKN